MRITGKAFPAVRRPEPSPLYGPALLMLLAACGGGGGSSPKPVTTDGPFVTSADRPVPATNDEGQPIQPADNDQGQVPVYNVPPTKMAISPGSATIAETATTTARKLADLTFTDTDGGTTASLFPGRMLACLKSGITPAMSG